MPPKRQHPADDYPDNQTMHDTYLRNRYEDGEIRVGTTVDSETAAAMFARVLEPLRPGLYVEIGPGLYPYVAHTNRAFTEDSRYVAYESGTSTHFGDREESGWLNPERDTYEGDREILESIVRHGSPFSEVRHIDAQALDLPDSEDAVQPVKEIFLSNVMAAPGMTPASIRNIVNECARVLAANGQLIIREEEIFTTPDLISNRLLSIFDALEEAGFGKRLVFAGVNSEAMIALGKVFSLPKSEGLRASSGTYIICQMGTPSAQPGSEP